MASFYTNFSGDDLNAFEDFLKRENVTPSRALLLIFREWRRYTAGSLPLPRYQTLNAAQLNLILGEAAEIKRGLLRCELALLEPRPILPEDLADWQAQQEAVRFTLQRVDRWQDALMRTGSIIGTAPVDPKEALQLAFHCYKFGPGPRGTASRELIFRFLRLFIEIPPPPENPPKAPSPPMPQTPIEGAKP